MSSSSSNTLKYSCTICGTTYSKSSGYKKHLKTKKHKKNLELSPSFVQDGKKNLELSPMATEIKKTDDPKPEIKRVILSETGEDIRYLYHLSDIHIPCERRHLEYRDVFSKFLQKIDENNLDHTAVVITGDYLDNKNRITPEEVILAREFVLELAHRVPTFIIAGNHDKNLNFKQREDNITAIVSNGSFPTKNLYYLKHTGVYKYNNILFGVSSVFDYRDVPVTELKSENNEHKIALFHGGVGKYVLYNGKYASKSSKNLSDFDGYDFVLLGDIHKWQFLDKDRVAYAGSMLQKNHGEDHTGHGYLLWDLDNKKVTHHSIINNYRFVTLTIIDGDLMTPLDDLPEHLYVRWDIKETGVDVKPSNKIQEYVRSRFVVEEERYTHSAFLPDMMYTEGPKTSFDLSVEKQREYMKAWLCSESKSVDEKDLSIIQKMFSDYNSKIKEDIPPVVNWRLVDLEFENIFCYKNKQTIQFDNMKGVNGIVAPNNAGKSAIFDILLFTLFGKCTRSDTYSYGDLVYQPSYASHDNVSPDHMLRCSVQIRTVENGYLYRITRCCTKERGSMLVIIEKNNIRQYHGSGRDGNSIITKMIGNFEDFMTTTVLAQNSVHNFLLMAGKAQKEFTARIFKLDLYDKIHKMAKKDLKKIIIDKKVALRTYEDISLENPKEKFSKVSLELEDIIRCSEENKEKVSVLTDALETLKRKVQILLPDEPIESREELSKYISSKYSERKKLLSLEIETIEDNQDYFINDSSDLSENIRKLEIYLKGLVKQDLTRYEEDIISLLNSSERSRVKLKNLRGKKARYSDHGRDISIIKSRSKIDDYKKEVLRTSRYLESIRDKLDDLKLVSKDLLDEKRSILISKLKEIPPQPNKGVFNPVRSYLFYDNEDDLIRNISEEQVRSQDIIFEIKDVISKVSDLSFGHRCTTPDVKHVSHSRVSDIYNLMRDTPSENSILWEDDIYVKKINEHKKLESDLYKVIQKLEDIKDKKKKLEKHRYNPECSFCCENPFVLNAKKIINEESSVITTSQKIRKNIETLKKDIISQDVLRERSEFLKELDKKLAVVIQKSELFNECLRKHNDNLDIEKDIILKKKDIAELEIEVSNLEKKRDKKRELQTLSDKLEELSGRLESDYTDLMSLLDTYEILNQEKKKVDDMIPKTEHKLYTLKYVLSLRSKQDDIDKDIQDTKKMLQIKIRNDDIRKKNKELDIHIFDIEKDLKKSRQEYDNIRRKEIELSISVKHLEDMLKKLKDSERDLEAVKRRSDLLSLFVSMTHHNGIPAFLLRKISRQMEDTVNDVLKNYSKMKIKLKNEGKETVIHVNNQFRSSGLNAKMLCGSEKFLVELAFRVAFQELSNVSKPNFLVCDEGWSCLDEEARGNLKYLLAALLEHNQYILTVSHINDVKAWMTRSISIDISDDGTHHVKQ